MAEVADFKTENPKGNLCKLANTKTTHSHCYACRDPIEDVIIESDTPVGAKAFCSMECWSLWCEINCMVNIDMREAALLRKRASETEPAQS